MFEDKTETETPKNEEEVTEEETTEETTETEEEETPETTPEEVEELKKKAELADNYKIRAEKAEAKLKKPPVEKKEETRLSDKDVIYLSKTDIHEDDVEEVTKYASSNKVTMKEAHEYLKPILDMRAEERTTAEATNTKTQARGSSKTDGAALLKKAEETGEAPTDEAGIRRMLEAEMDRKKAQAK